MRALKRRFRVNLIFFCLPALSQTHFAHLDTYLTLPDPTLLKFRKSGMDTTKSGMVPLLILCRKSDTGKSLTLADKPLVADR